MAIETFLSSGPLSLSELIDTLRIQSHDETDTPVFNDAQIKLAIRRAVIRSHSRFFTTESYALSFTSGDFDYTLPDYVRRIVRITRDRTGSGSFVHLLNNLSGDIPDETLHHYRHFYSRGNNALSFTKDYPTGTFTIWYERDVQVPIDERHLGAALTDVATTMTLVNANPQLANLALPAYFKIDNEIIKLSAFSSNTAVTTIARGQFSTTAAAHDNGKILSQVLVADSDAFYDFLLMQAGYELNRMRVQQGNASISVSANITAARLFKEDAAEMLKENRQPRKGRRMKFSRDRRPRRII